MVTGILAANVNEKFFDQVLLDLQKTAITSVHSSTDIKSPHLPQVHALNCLKDVFTNTRFGVATETHLASTLILAVECLENSM